MLTPGIIFKTDIHERAGQLHKREYVAALLRIRSCPQWLDKANVVSYIDITLVTRTPRLTRPVTLGGHGELERRVHLVAEAAARQELPGHGRGAQAWLS
jgi:hypothetical protein